MGKKAKTAGCKKKEQAQKKQIVNGNFEDAMDGLMEILQPDIIIPIDGDGSEDHFNMFHSVFDYTKNKHTEAESKGVNHPCIVLISKGGNLPYTYTITVIILT